jgi:hypothetical protein
MLARGSWAAWNAKCYDRGLEVEVEVEEGGDAEKFRRDSMFGCPTTV